MALATVSLTVFLVMALAVTASSGAIHVPSYGSYTCNNSTQCALNEMCVDNTCMDPCTFINCPENAKCRARNHRASCVTVVGECKTDNDCKEEESCDEIEEKCVDPCVGRCGKNTICTVNQHIPNCECEPGYVGEPNIECVWPECNTHYDCPTNRTCISYMCVDPCTGRCGTNTVCEVHRFMPQCTCKPGYSGNPLVKCDKPECITNDNCSTNSSCVSYKCVDPCHGRCGSNAECLVHRHVPDCSCKPGYTGNPLVNCTNPNKEKSFRLETRVKVNFFKAIELCAIEDMRLATFDSEAEYNKLVNLMKSQPETDQNIGYWLSGKKLRETKRWIWLSNGEPLNYTKWAEREPNNHYGVEECIEVRPEFDYQMNDLQCSLEKYFVCETYGPTRR